MEVGSEINFVKNNLKFSSFSLNYFGSPEKDYFIVDEYFLMLNT